MKKRNIRVDLNKQRDVEKNIRHFSELSTEKLIQTFNTSYEKGISSIQVEHLKEKYDKNIIVIGHKNTMFRRLINSLINPFNLI